jgi:hypothetical protein
MPLTLWLNQAGRKLLRHWLRRARLRNWRRNSSAREQTGRSRRCGSSASAGVRSEGYSWPMRPGESGVSVAGVLFPATAGRCPNHGPLFSTHAAQFSSGSPRRIRKHGRRNPRGNDVAQVSTVWQGRVCAVRVNGAGVPGMRGVHQERFRGSSTSPQSFCLLRNLAGFHPSSNFRPSHDRLPRCKTRQQERGSRFRFSGNRARPFYP